MQGLLKHLADGQGVPTAAAVPLPTAEIGESGAPGEVELQWVAMPTLDHLLAHAQSLLASSPPKANPTGGAPHAANPHPPPSHAAQPASPSASASSLSPPFRTLAHSLFVACAPHNVSHASLQGYVGARPADLLASIARDLYTAVSQPLVPGTRAAVCVVANLDTGYVLQLCI